MAAAIDGDRLGAAWRRGTPLTRGGRVPTAPPSSFNERHGGILGRGARAPSRPVATPHALLRLRGGAILDRAVVVAGTAVGWRAGQRAPSTLRRYPRRECRVPPRLARSASPPALRSGGGSGRRPAPAVGATAGGAAMGQRGEPGGGSTAGAPSAAPAAISTADEPAGACPRRTPADALRGRIRPRCSPAGFQPGTSSWPRALLPAPAIRFGSAMAVGDGVIAVGAYLARLGGADSGAVYLFHRDPPVTGGWSLVQPRLAGPPATGVGFDVALDGATTLIVVGCDGERRHGARTGAAIIFDLRASGRRRSAGSAPWPRCRSRAAGRRPNRFRGGGERRRLAVAPG